MALLALTVALLAMTVATTAYKLRPLDVAWDSFDDQYQNCSRAMEEALPALNRSEFQNNPLFAQVWVKAVAEWERWGSRVSPLSSPDQAIAIMAYTMDDLYEEFNEEVRVAGRSPQAYQDNFHFKTLHFLLTDALAMLGVTQEQKCRCVFWGSDKYLFEAKAGDIVRFGHFVTSVLCENVAHIFENTTKFLVQTCHSVDIPAFSEYPEEKQVLIPPSEKFKVSNVDKQGEKVEITLDSIGTYSKYKCEWLTGGSIPRAPWHLGGLLLATTVLAVAAGNL